MMKKFLNTLPLKKRVLQNVVEKGGIITTICIATYETTFAALGRSIQQRPGNEEVIEKSDGITLDGLGGFFAGFFGNIIPIIGYVMAILAIIFIIYKSIRLAFELYYSRHLRYLKITVPRADSKLDKERETKKDFKGKNRSNVDVL